MAELEKCSVLYGENESALRVCMAAAGNSHIMLLHLEQATEDQCDAWILDGLERLVMYLQTVYASPDPERPSLVVVVWDCASGTLHERVGVQSCWEAVRGVVHTLTMECRADKMRLNAALADATSIGQLEDLLGHLGNGAADFVAGNTFDLREWL